MKISFERIYKELSQEEGVRYKIYKCTAGHDTIGIGHNLDASSIDSIIGRRLDLNPVLSEDEVKKVFKSDLDVVSKQLDQNLPWWSSLPVFAQYALISLCFNMGIGKKISSNPLKYNGLLGFRNTLKAFEERRWADAASGLKASTWYKQVGNRGPKIVSIVAAGVFPDNKTE